MAAAIIGSEGSMLALVAVLMVLALGLAAALLAATRDDTDLVRNGTVRPGAVRPSAARTGPAPTASRRRAGGACPEPPTVGHLH
jgi:hypothetical protein